MRRRYRDNGQPVHANMLGFGRWDVGWVHHWTGDSHILDPKLNRMVLCIEMELVDDGFPESKRSRGSDQTARV